MCVTDPCQNFNAVILLPLEVISNVVNNDCLFNVSSQAIQVFDVDPVIVIAMVAVQPVVDQFDVLLVDVVENEVSIILQGCSEHNYFEFLCHVFQEFDTPGSKFKLFLLGHKMD